MKKRFKKIYIEITNNCNLDCSFCIKNKRDKKFISTKEFSNLLNRLENHTDYLYFHVMGEPLLHPNINELIALASDKFKINITTNGYLLNRVDNNKNIRQINISLHSYDNKYNRSLDDYLDNIFTSVDHLKETTIIKYRLWTNTPYKDEIIDRLNKKYNKDIKNNCKLASNIYYEEAREFIWPSLDNNYYNETGTCKGTIDHIGILVDGTVIPCCLDSNGTINLGNIYETNLDNIINTKLFNDIYKGFLNNKKVCELCKKCNFYFLKK